MSLDRRAQVLEAIASNPSGVRELLDTLGWRASNVVSLLKAMNEERLIELQQAKHSRRGRPKKIIMCTPLGFEFLQTFKTLQMKPIRARREDLEHAVKDALYTRRLAEYGHSPFKLFMELNTIVRNIKVSSQVTETVRR